MEADLRALEEKVSQFVDLCQRLRGENRALRQQLAHAINDNKQLTEKVEAARARLEGLLTNLPEAES